MKVLKLLVHTHTGETLKESTVEVSREQFLDKSLAETELLDNEPVHVHYASIEGCLWCGDPWCTTGETEGVCEY